MTYVLAQLAPLGALVAAIGIAGVALERALPGAPLTPALRPLSCVVLGVVLWMLALFGLACAGLLGAAGIVVLALVCALAWIASPRRAAAPAADSSSATWRSGARFVAAAVLFTLPLWVLALCWDVSWDAGTYHLALPKRYLAAGGFVPVPGNVYSNWPLATELLFAAAMAIGSHPVANALHACFGLATLWALWLGAGIARQEPAGWIAALLVLASPVVLFEWPIAYVDLACAFFFIAGILFVARWREGGEDARRSLWLVGVCGGALAGVKVNGVLGAAALGCALLPTLVARAARGELRGSLRDALRFGVPVLLLWLPWLGKSAAYTGNPFYPLAFEWFGGPDWSARLSEQLLSWQRSIGMGRDALDYLLLPVRVTLEAGPSYDRFGARIGAHWLFVLPLCWPARHHALVRSGLLASAAYFAFWALGSQQARFLIPILPALALCAGLGVSEALARLELPLRRAGTALALAAALGLALPAMRPYALRALERLPSLVAGEQALRVGAVHPVYHFVATLPPDSRLLLMNTNQGFFLSRDYVADSFLEASQIADALRDAATAAQAHEWLRDRGFTHVLRAQLDWGIEWPSGLAALLGDPSLAPRRFLAPDASYEVFELAERGEP